ncbi:DUF1646 family protein [Cytobacillus purgationiresistens]|uniref:Cation transporter n=1 Tax=Cytobacillus purgationiresistens TaxID=863449 RepID=A0ABU0ABM8_9BACI|nr:DUF1646 family protein [Cytobacillus purgationiresistens]MDQ0268279.1 putative cation transporter [Cytobacillus purgationiresistens]
MILGLAIVFLLVLLLPFTMSHVEKNLEIFLFFMGLISVFISGVYSEALFLKAAFDPIKISIAVLVAGLFFKWFQRQLESIIVRVSRMVPFRLFCAFIVIFLGLISSMITAIIAALVLVLITSSLNLERKAQIRLVVLACFSIGLGAALTPIGEPLSTIAISKLNEDFFFLVRLVGVEIVAAILFFGLIAAIYVSPPKYKKNSIPSLHNQSENYADIFIRSLKIYFFVMGLTFLGAGFEPIINRYVVGLDPSTLYWINILSAVLDNATLAAAEISPSMSHDTVRAILLGLLISGGMLVPGNIPNIISAGKLEISSKEWAKFGLPVGFLFMVAYFIVLMVIK